MNVGWPEGILLFLMVLSLGVSIAKHGEPRDPHSAGTALVAFLLTVSLLWWGGFFA